MSIFIIFTGKAYHLDHFGKSKTTSFWAPFLSLRRAVLRAGSVCYPWCFVAGAALRPPDPRGPPASGADALPRARQLLVPGFVLGRSCGPVAPATQRRELSRERHGCESLGFCIFRVRGRRPSGVSPSCPWCWLQDAFWASFFPEESARRGLVPLLSTPKLNSHPPRHRHRQSPHFAAPFQRNISEPNVTRALQVDPSPI